MTIHRNYKYTACSSRICGVSLESAVECFGQCTTNMCRLVHRALSNYYHFNTFVEKKIKTKWHRGATLKARVLCSIPMGELSTFISYLFILFEFC